MTTNRRVHNQDNPPTTTADAAKLNRSKKGEQRAINNFINKLNANTADSSRVEMVTYNLEESVRILIKRKDLANNKRVMNATDKKVKEMRRLFPNDQRILIIQGMFREVQHKNNSALHIYKVCYAKYPQYWRAYTYAASLLQKQNRWAESVDVLEKMIGIYDKESKQSMYSEKHRQTAQKLLDHALKVIDRQKKKAEAQVAKVELKAENIQKKPLQSPAVSQVATQEKVPAKPQHQGRLYAENHYRSKRGNKSAFFQPAKDTPPHQPSVANATNTTYLQALSRK